MFLRFGGLMLIFPLFIMARIPVKVRMAMALMIGVVLAGYIPTELNWRAVGMGEMASIVFFELCSGVLMGLVCRMVFYALEIAGLRISTDSGLFITMNFSGMEGIPQQAPSIILFLLASIMMVAMELHYFIIEAVQTSYQFLPIGGGQFHGGIINHLGDLIGKVFLMGVMIAAPVMTIGFMINFIMSLLGRAVTRISVFSESFSIRLICGIGVFGATIAVMAEYIANFIRTIPNSLVITARIFAGH
ncbi:MAG: flagellar biosynthetic protein FliR [Verrucomicrobia bacterium]|nr:flagellar biosynthetic protein FliR [Verrucomicrobiota bacterium]